MLRMILHRFCSAAEFLKYQSGVTLENHTDHYQGGHGGSVSRGFCFFAGNVKEWARRLNGIVEFDVLLTVDVDPAFVNRSMGVYADWSKDNGRDAPPAALYPEYCTEAYDWAHFHYVSAERIDNKHYVSKSYLLQHLQ